MGCRLFTSFLGHGETLFLRGNRSERSLKSWESTQVRWWKRLRELASTTEGAYSGGVSHYLHWNGQLKMVEFVFGKLSGL